MSDFFVKILRHHPHLPPLLVKNQKNQNTFSIWLCVVVAVVLFQRVEPREAVGTAFVIIGKKKTNFSLIRSLREHSAAKRRTKIVHTFWFHSSQTLTHKQRTNENTPDDNENENVPRAAIGRDLQREISNGNQQLVQGSQQKTKIGRRRDYYWVRCDVRVRRWDNRRL